MTQTSSLSAHQNQLDQSQLDQNQLDLDHLTRRQFRALFKGRSVVLTDLAQGVPRRVAERVNEDVGRGDATLYTKAEHAALFTALLAEPGLADPADPARLGPGAHDAVQQYLDVAVTSRTFFDEPMYVVTVSGWPQDKLKPGSATLAPPTARVSVWRSDPRDTRHVPPSGPSGTLFTSTTFSLANSGNRTATAPKRSWKVNVSPGEDDDAIAGMTRLNLKSMWNDPSQMREAIAWGLFDGIDVPASRHTFAKFALNGVYKGLFSVIEQVDRRFLREHFGSADEGNLYKAYCGDIGCATLQYRGDAGQAYRSKDPEDGTYRLQTNEDDPARNTYDDLAVLVRTINGNGLPGTRDQRFASDAFRARVSGVLDVEAFLRWASLNVLLGSWDNYFATPSNYYLYNRGPVDDPYFTFIPWDYDNCLGIDYFGADWQYTDLLDWPANTAAYWKAQGGSHLSPVPLVTNLLANHDLAQYYLDHVEHLLDTVFTTDAIDARIADLWQRVSQAAYQESDTPWGQPFTERQFTNDEVYRSASRQEELHKGQSTVLGIHHYVRMRHDSARRQLRTLRRDYPAGASGAEFLR